MPCDQALPKLSEKLFIRTLEQEKDGFEEGELYPFQAAGARKKPGEDRVKRLAVSVGKQDLRTFLAVSLILPVFFRALELRDKVNVLQHHHHKGAKWLA